MAIDYIKWAKRLEERVFDKVYNNPERYYNEEKHTIAKVDDLLELASEGVFEDYLGTLSSDEAIELADEFKEYIIETIQQYFDFERLSVGLLEMLKGESIYDGGRSII